jgi:arylsulfatase A-like enzyme
MKQPNIIFIVADDLGSADLGCYGSHASFPVSPVLDQLAANGLRLTQAYSNSPVCSPSRFAFMTGCYQYRFRGAAEEPLGTGTRGSSVLGLPPNVPTLASMLKAAGYNTALVGKWHLGFPPNFGPRQSGYDYFFGSTAGAVDYFSHQDTYGVHDLFENEAEYHCDSYLTDAYTDKACEWVAKQSADKPFLLSLHYTAPHWPWVTRDDRAESERIGRAMRHIDGGSLETYWRMVHHMDEGIGKLMATLQAQGLDHNTLLVFTSDNGGERFSENWPFVGGKMDLLEGGIRVPLIAHWPARIKPGRVDHSQTLTMDWSATMLAAAGVDVSALDGIDLADLIDGQALPERSLYWRMNHRNQRALRRGDWKYLKVDEHEYLFNVQIDPRERANKKWLEASRLEQMRADWETWAQTMPGIPADAKVINVYNESELPKATY